MMGVQLCDPIHSTIVIVGHAQRGRVPAEVAPRLLHEPQSGMWIVPTIVSIQIVMCEVQLEASVVNWSP